MLSLSDLKGLLREEDVEGFIEIHGAPEDEYDSEAKEIFLALKALELNDRKKRNIIPIISLIWAKSFNLDKTDIEKRIPAFERIAQKIFQ